MYNWHFSDFFLDFFLDKKIFIQICNTLYKIQNNYIKSINNSKLLVKYIKNPK